MTRRGQAVGRWIRQSAKLIGLLGALGVLVYWLHFAPVPVLVHEVQQGEIVAEVMGTGTLEAQRKATVSPKIAGRITEVVVDQGQHVTSRQVLVKLDDSELRQQVGIAEANLTAAQAALARTSADKTRTTAVLAQAQREHQRNLALLERQVTSQGVFDKALESLQVAEANVTYATAAVTESQKQLLAAEKTLAYHRARLDDTVITAPFDGLIVRRYRDPGDVVVPGSAVLLLIALEELWVSAWVDETQMAQLQPGQPTRVVFRSAPVRTYMGHVVRLGRETDRETREFLIDIHVEALPTHWAVGQRAEVYIQTARKAGVTLLPTPLLLWQEQRPGVFVQSNGQAEWRPLQLGLRTANVVEVLEGLLAGERVVTPRAPQSHLTTGQRLRLP